MGSHSNLSTSESSSRPLTPLPTYRPASCPAPSAPAPTRITANGPLSPARGPTVAASHIMAVGRGQGLQVTVDAQEFTPETPALTLGNSSSSPSHEGLASGSDHESGDDTAASCVDSEASIPEPVAQVLQQAQYLRKHRRNRHKPKVQRLSGPAGTANPPAPAAAPTPSRIVQQHQHQQAPRRRILLTSEQQNIWIAKGRVSLGTLSTPWCLVLTPPQCTYSPIGTCAEETINGSAFCAIVSRARRAPPRCLASFSNTCTALVPRPECRWRALSQPCRRPSTVPLLPHRL